MVAALLEEIDKWKVEEHEKGTLHGELAGFRKGRLKLPVVN